LVLINSQGFVIYKSEIIDMEEITIDISNYISGTYFIRLLDDRFYSEAMKIVVL